MKKTFISGAFACALFAVASVSGGNRTVASSATKVATWALNFVLQFVGDKLVSAPLQKQVPTLPEGASRDADNWGGLYVSDAEQAYVVVIDDGPTVHWYMDTECCVHFFTGRRDAGVVRGTMFRRVKKTWCLTEYTVPRMQRSSVGSTKLEIDLKENPSLCGAAAPDPFKRVFTLR